MRLIEQFKAIPSNASPKRLIKKYLEFCWSLPYYGSAMFRGLFVQIYFLYIATDNVSLPLTTGQIETPAKSLTSLVINEDTEVAVAINGQGLYVIDPDNVVSVKVLMLQMLVWLEGVGRKG